MMVADDFMALGKVLSLNRISFQDVKGLSGKQILLKLNCLYQKLGLVLGCSSLDPLLLVEALPGRQVLEEELKVGLVAPLFGQELVRCLRYDAFESRLGSLLDSTSPALLSGPVEAHVHYELHVLVYGVL